MTQHQHVSYDDFLKRCIAPFADPKFIYDTDRGWIVWRVGTGENVELLHIRTFITGQGLGRALLYRMLDALKEKPPYYSVFGFTRSSNEEAQLFYGALGFNLQSIQGLYQDGTAVMFWQSFQKLLEERQCYEDSLRSKAQQRC